MAKPKYAHRLENRGHGIYAVYSTGPDSEIRAIERAGRAYARHHLTFEPGLSGGPSSGGGAFDGKGGYEAQQIFITKKLPPRED